jgi:hypothetical protein
VLADLQISDRDVSDFDPDQLQDFGVERLHHSADLAISPFRDGDLEEREARRIAHTSHFGRPRGTVR